MHLRLAVRALAPPHLDVGRELLPQRLVIAELGDAREHDLPRLLRLHLGERLLVGRCEQPWGADGGPQDTSSS
eukprot:2020117-Prymnesium_polylepis.1